MKTKYKKKLKTITKKVLKLILWLHVIFLAIIVIAYIFVRIKYPPDEIKHIFEVQASKALNNRVVKIEKVSLNLLKGFLFKNIIVYELNNIDSTSQDNQIFFALDEAIANYKLLSLFRRSLKINEIKIDHPQINFSIKNNVTNIDDLISPGQTKKRGIDEQDTTSTPLNLPVSFELDKFDFKNLDAFFKSESDTTTIHANLNNFSIFINELTIPRGGLDEIKENVKTNLTIISPKSRWKVFLKTLALKNPIELDYIFDMNVNLNVAGLADMLLEGVISVGDIKFVEFGSTKTITKVPVSNLLQLALNLNIDGSKGNVGVNHIKTEIADEAAFTITGNITDLLTMPNFALNFDKSEINLDRFLATVKAITPSEYQSLIDGAMLDGTLSFNGTKVTGKPTSAELAEGLKFTTNIKLDNINAQYNIPQIDLKNLFVKISAQGIFYNQGMGKSSVSTKLNLDSCFFALNDTIALNLHDFSTNLTAEISEELFPTKIKLKSNIAEIFDAVVDLGINFKANNKLQDYDAKLSMTITDLNTQRLPLSPVSTFINTKLNANSSALNDIKMSIDLLTDSLYLDMPDDELTINPININGKFNIAMEKEFKKFHLKNFQLMANDFLSLEGGAELNLQREVKFNAHLDSILLLHKKLFDFIPKSFKTGLENLSIDGESLFSLQVNGKIPQQSDPEISTTAHGKLNANIDYPDVPITINSINTTIDLNSDLKSASAILNMSIDDVLLKDIRKLPIKNTTLKLQCKLPDFNQLQLDTASLSIPEFASDIKFWGDIDSLSTNPSVSFDLTYNFNSEDSVLIIDDIYILGDLGTSITFQFLQPVVKVNGDVSINGLDAYLIELGNVIGIFGSIPFNQKIDIENLALVNDESVEHKLVDISSINYNLLRPYYNNSDDAIPYLKIKNVEMLEYKVSDVNFDIKLGNGKINIPKFSMSLYDGNINGNIFADFGEGKLDEVEYNIKANVSQLNSAKLSPHISGSEDDSELNMNMALKGVGLDPELDIDFDGYLYITKIGSRFTDNVLSSLDPKGTDKSIRDTKRLLKWGYKPKLISFEIKHGNMYPTIHLVKGNLLTKLIPLNLSGGKIELARIPIKFFLETQIPKSN